VPGDMVNMPAACGGVVIFT